MPWAHVWPLLSYPKKEMELTQTLFVEMAELNGLPTLFVGTLDYIFHYLIISLRITGYDNIHK